jgi:hypothetical protein
MKPITDIEQIAWQRKAHALLGELLAQATRDHLPPVTWTIGQAGAILHGNVGSSGADRRRADFSAWRAVLGTPDSDLETPDGGAVRLRAIWLRMQGVKVILSATIWEEET